jgi:hypothetical protein
MTLTRNKLGQYWYILSLGMIVGSLSFSKIGLSIGEFMLTGGWIMERFNTKKISIFLNSGKTWQTFVFLIPYSVYLVLEGIANGFKQFFRNKPALLFSSIFLFHILGLFFTTDFDYAVKDLRTKFPLFLLPLMLSTSRFIEKKGFYYLMLFFILTVLVRSVFNTWLIETHRFIDIRDVSRNVSHIIFSLLLTLSIFTLLFFSLKNKLWPLWIRLLCLLVLIWFFIYIIRSQSFTGFSITLITLMILIPVLIFKTRKRWLQAGLLFSILLVTVSAFFTIRSIVNDYYRVIPVDYSLLEKNTSRGNPYIHNGYSTQTENGNYLWLYIQWDELRSSWNMRSRIPFDSLNLKKEPVAYTVIRFLTSKGERKDADAVEKLSQEEISAIEKGVANYVFMKEFSIRGRIYEFLWGFDNYRETGNPTGSTLMQRLEFWKASVGIIRDYWLTGVGTGDMNIAFQEQYEKMNTKLAPDQRWRSHNQFLSIFVGFGIIGLLWFLVSIFYPPLMLQRLDDYFLVVFLIIALLSMLTEDTIESQTGVTFFAFFYSFFLFARKEKDTLISKTNPDG